MRIIGDENIIIWFFELCQKSVEISGKLCKNAEWKIEKNHMNWA